MEIVLATNNLHKIREFRDMIKSIKALRHLDVLSLLNFPEYEAPEEIGTTFCENAMIKAIHAGATLKKLVLADDSGLMVPALSEGGPAVYSKRYAGPDATDVDNRAKLLMAMETLKDEERYAYFECCLALANEKGLLKSVMGTVEGTLLAEERGRNGFGYDPLFVKHDYDKTFAELDEATKNKISHRRKALEKMLHFLETYTV